MLTKGEASVRLKLVMVLPSAFPTEAKRETGALAYAPEKSAGFSDGIIREDIKIEQNRCCPRNCKRRAEIHHATGMKVPGRRIEVLTREPGDLP